jgi:hypothetical protein
VAARPRLAEWVDTIAASGPGRVAPMTAADALAIAGSVEPADLAGVEGGHSNAFAVGDRVAIRADDFGQEQVRGVVARITPEEITVTRQEPALGQIAVHFPRSGYVIVSESSARPAT